MGVADNDGQSTSRSVLRRSPSHHHLMHAARQVNGSIMWANLHLLFWLSVIPFTTGRMGENHFVPLPMRQGFDHSLIEMILISTGELHTEGLISPGINLRR